jgi:anti-anti-sigma factor
LFIREIANRVYRADKQSLGSTLRVSVTAGDSGPIITLAGEADVTNAGQLHDVITAQLATGTVYLTIDAAELSFADSRSIGILTGAAKTLKELGGGLVLLRPQRALVRTLTLLGADRVLTIHPATDITHEPKGDTPDSP